MLRQLKQYDYCYLPNKKIVDFCKKHRICTKVQRTRLPPPHEQCPCGQSSCAATEVVDAVSEMTGEKAHEATFGARAE